MTQTQKTVRNLFAAIGLATLVLPAGCGMFDRLGIAWQITNTTVVPCTSASIYFFDDTGKTVYGASTNLDRSVGLQIGPDLNAKVLNLSGQAHAATDIAYAVAQCYAPSDPKNPVGPRFASSERVAPVIEDGSMWFRVPITKSDAVPVVSDRDGDGVVDALDACDDVKGLPENDGCPATPPPPVPPTGDCATVPTGTRDSMFSQFVCWPTAGGSVVFNGARLLESLNSLPRVWVDTGKLALPPIVWLNTQEAIGTYFTLYDRMGRGLPQMDNVGSGTMYVLDPMVAVIKSNIGLDFKRIIRDMKSDALTADKCPTSTIVTGADTCQP